MANKIKNSLNKVDEFRDFPCLYFMNTFATRDEQIRFFGCLAALFGKSIHDAVNYSLLFGHASGLFSGKGLSLNELEAFSQVYFDSPFNECKQFYRQATIRKLNMRDKCCVVCEHSVSYTNARIESERIVLKSLLEGRRDAYAQNPTADSFHSYAPISCDCENGFLPVIHFNALLFRFLTENDLQFDEAAFSDYIKDIERDSLLFIDDSVIRKLISLELRQISGVANYSVSNIAPSVLRINAPYTYKPPKLVLPEGATKPDKVKKASAVSDKLRASGSTAPSVPKTGAQITFESLFASTSLRKADSPVAPVDAMKEPEHPDTAILVPEDVSAMVSSKDVIKQDIVGVIPDADDEPQISDNEPEAESCHPLSVDVSDIANKKKRKRKKKNKHLYVSVPAVLPKGADKMLQRWWNHFLQMHYLLPFCFPYRNALVSRGSACASCHECRSFMASDLCNCTLEGLLTYYYVSSCYAGAATPKSSNRRPWWGTDGCALSGNSDTAPCAFGVNADEISSSFLPYVIDCSGIHIENIIDFVSEACNSHHISLEYAVYDGVDGLLFFVNGKYYFFNPHYDTAGFIRPLLSDAAKVRFYSINPIPVHACLSKLGFKRVRIESVAAFYSVAVGINALLPLSLVFHLQKQVTHPDYFVRIMPYYPEVFQCSFSKSVYANRRRYEQKIRLEWALGFSDDLSNIARGHCHCVSGGNFLNYRLTFSNMHELTESGSLFTVKLRRGSHRLNGWELLDFWEDVAGRVAATSLKFMDYSYLIALSCDGIAYYSSYDTTHFYDILLDVIRASYREIVGPGGGVPDIVVECEKFS